jgi:uracil-DNA glycosylase family protein
MCPRRASEAIRRQPPSEFGTAAELIPPRPSLPKLREVAAGCTACDLHLTGTQTVFGEGPSPATVMFVGEQPGDQEDKAGHPFVGPSGKLLDSALAAAEIDRREVYVTNVVKHFKWERGEKSARRIHKKPNAAEINACRPWLDAEIRLVKPGVIVCLGATAAQSLLGKQFRITRDRGKPIRQADGPVIFATVHPSAVLRSPDPESRDRAEREFFADLKRVARFLRDEGMNG